MKLSRMLLCVAGATLLGTSAFAQEAPSSGVKDAGVMSLPLSAYPKASRARGEEGSVGYRVDVSAEGELRSCEITKSSGHNRLDKATCELMIHHVKFSPDTNGEGRPLDSIIEGSIVWKLPKGESNS